MVRRPLSRYRSFIAGAGLASCLALLAPQMAAATPLDDDGCKRLETEREALVVLGIDKYFEHGVEWAKTNLNVADLNLVKRYLEVFEQLRFRCKEDLDIVAGDDSEDEDRDETASHEGGAPPVPEKKLGKQDKQSQNAAAPTREPVRAAQPTATKTNSFKNVTSIQMTPARAAPSR